MSDLERDLRATFDRLADVGAPSEDLVERTMARSGELRRRRRLVAASGFAAVALAVTIGVASIAGAGAHGAQVRVTNSSIPSDESTSTSVATTTTAEPTTTTFPGIIIPGSSYGHSTNPRPTTPTPTTGPAISFIPTACPAGSAGSEPEAQTFTLLTNGDIRVHLEWIWSSESASFVDYRLDDGTTGSTDLTKEYTPAEFGPHWYDEWNQGDTGPPGCSVRHNFDVNPATATPDSTPGTTGPQTTTTSTVTTTVPKSTTTTSAP